MSWVVLKNEGESGPKLIDPLAVATKKLTTEPRVNRKPVIAKLAPAWTLAGIELMNGPGVGEGVGVWVAVAVRVGVALGVFVGVAVAVAVEVGVPLAVVVGVPVGMRVGVRVGD